MGRRGGVLGDAGSRNPGRRPRVPASSYKDLMSPLSQDSLDLSCVTNSAISELYRGIRQQAPSLLGISEENMGLMSLGLAHSLSRYKLKFSPDKVDTMIIQAICEFNFSIFSIITLFFIMISKF